MRVLGNLVSALLVALLVVTISSAASVALFIGLHALSASNGSRVGIFFLSFVLTVAAHGVCFSFANRVNTMWWVAMRLAVPARSRDVLFHSAKRYWLTLISLAVILPLAHGLVPGNGIIMVALLMTGLLASVLSWLCAIHGASAFPLQLSFALMLKDALLWRPATWRIPIGAIVIPAIIVILNAAPRVIGWSPLQTFEDMLSQGMLTLVIVQLIHPFAVPFLWMSMGADTSEGILMTVFSLLLLLPPLLAFIRNIGNVKEIPETPTPNIDQPLCDPGHYRDDPRETAANVELDTAAFGTFHKSIAREEAHNEGLAAEQVEEIWAKSHYPEYLNPPNHLSATVRNILQWYLGVASGMSLPRKLHLLLVRRPRGCGIALLCMVAVAVGLWGHADRFLTIALVTYCVALYVQFVSADIEIARMFKGHALPLSYRQFQVEGRREIGVVWWLIDSVLALLLWFHVGGGIQNLLIILASLAMVRLILRLHAIYSSVVPRKQADHADVPQTLCLFLAIIHGFAIVSFLIADNTFIPAQRALDSAHSFLILLFLLFLPTVIQWLVILALLRWRAVCPPRRILV